ncbi:unnamed protein product [Bemisia tabaci]|uniref:Nuclear transcription factor Y subunit beta n=1 Tax=Bemisia tabaci TaxID=7038 RepID=A0A9P0ADW0_BEMTA|nr:PREDICTED: nuclear transcription factor Y subunit B-1 [Bemisia tabaci]CAH0389695.1 unnamed protein product [Bemisia tabaci]
MDCNSDSGDEISSAFLTGNGQGYIINDDMDDDAVLTGENSDDSNHDGDPKSSRPLREQDRFLPIANVAKIMKKAIPPRGKIAKDARECVQECVSEFISFITSEASERCHQEKRKTINGEDILFAMTNLGFDNYIESLKIYLQKYREATKGDKSTGHIYEEIDDCFASPSISGNMIAQNGQEDTIVYTTYQEPLQQFHMT